MMKKNLTGSALRLIGFCILLLSLCSGGCGNSPSVEMRRAASSAHLTVELVNVKKVDGQYRYFCGIHNVGSTPFSGSVTVHSVNRKGDTVGGKSFTTSRPLPPGLRMVVYFDQYTGPAEVDGDLGIASLRLTMD